MGLRFFILLVLAFSGFPASAAEMSVEQAYQAVGDTPVPFDARQSQASPEEARFLEHLFFVTDMAMRVRAQTLAEFYRGDVGGLSAYNAEIDDLLSSFDMVQTPPALKNVQDMIVDAINQQKTFFNEWAKTAGTPKFVIVMRAINNDPLVLAAHDDLINAYSELVQLYPGETEYNKKAFYAHLCALDFI